MPNYEVYRMDIVVDVTDEQAEVKLKNLDRTIQSTQKHAGNLGKTDATPHVDKRARTELSNTEKVLGSAKKRADVLHRTRVNPTISMKDRITSSLKRVESNIGRLTRSSHKIVLEGVDRVTGVAKRIISTITSPLALLGAGAGVGAGIFFPLKLAGEFEQAQMSLDFYMGSVEEGERAFQDLIRFAKDTPFEFPFLQEMTIQLMGTGYNFEQAKRALQAFGDAAGRTGAGMQGIEASLLGFTQIASAGTLNLQDLKQVALHLKLPLNIFAKELGVAESEIGNIGKKAIPAQKAMEAIVRTLEQRFAGGLKELSNSLLGMTAVIKDTATLTVWHFGKGMAEPVKRIMFDIIGLTDETGGAFEEFQKRLERAGERVGRKFEQMYKGAKRFFRELTSMPGWNKMTWSEKVTLALDKILESVTAWLKGPGGEAIKETGEILGRLLAAGLEGAQPHIIPVAVELGKTLGGAVVQGIYEAIKANPWAGILLGAYVGFRIAGPKGAAIGAGIGAATWGLPKGFEALGKHIPGSGHYTRERLAEYERAEQMFEELKAVTPPGEPLFPGTELRAMPKRAIGGIFSRPHTALVAEAGPEAIIPLSVGMRSRALALYEETGRRLGVRPYAKGRFAGAVPVAAPAMSGASGIGGLFGGQALADRVNEWIDGIDFGRLKTRAIKTWEDIRLSIAYTWERVKEIVSLETLARGARYLLGYLESTIFSGEWWQGKWENVRTWAADKWAAMSEVWENTKEILNSTIFSSEWWQGHWESVAGWTSEKWDEMKTVWETVKSDISSTLFSKTWWESKWENVKTWASGVLDDITARWESIKESFQAGREAGQAAAAHAAGGIFSSPHLGMVAEAGPEAIIPLSSKMRDRGIELWKQAGRFLGIAPHAEGGIFGSSKLVTEAGPEAGIPFSRSPERIRERGLGLWQQINNVFSPAMPALALAGSGAETGLLYDGIDYGPELSGQVQELNVPISIANITANISGSSLDVEDIAEQVGEQVKQQVKWEITRELANAIENRI